MGFHLKNKDASVADAVRRIADEQIGKAIAAIEKPAQAEAIHDVRKRCKKLRGMLRLVRPGFDSYSRENAAFRDIASAISATRDAKVMQDTYDLLTHEFEDQIDRRALGSIRRRFTLQRNAELENGTRAQNRIDTLNRLLEARVRVSSWEFADDDWKAVEDGLKKTYERARDAAKQARQRPDAVTLHEVRKRIKYHWYHCRLLENLWPEMMDVRQHVARRLSDILGDHHDLDVFTDKLNADPTSFGNPRDVEAAIGLAKARQARLEQEAWPNLDRLLAQSPESLGKHFGTLWDVWKKGG